MVTSIDGCMDHLLPLEEMREAALRITQTSLVEPEALKLRLVNMGYERCAQVEEAGQFAVRGGIVDIFPLTEESPYRLEFWDDEVDSIRSFDAQSPVSYTHLTLPTIA